MPLTNCPECGKKISDSANHCIKCGYVVKPSRKLYLIGALALVAVLSYYIQVYMYPEAGKTKENKSYVYTFQRDYWSEMLTNKLVELTNSKLSDKLKPTTGKKITSPEYLQSLQEYHDKVLEILNILNHLGDLSVNIVEETQPVVNKGINGLTAEEQRECDYVYVKFKNLFQTNHRRWKKVSEYLPALVKQLNVDASKLDANGQARVIKTQMNMLSNLYSDEDYFLSKKTNTGRYVNDYYDTSNKIIVYYKKMLYKYNSEVTMEEAKKNTLLILLVAVTACITFYKEWT